MTDQPNHLALVVVGMCGAGKSLVSEYLKSQSWNYLRFGQVTIDEIGKRSLLVNEANERLVREELRASGGMDIYAALLWPKIELALTKGSVVIDGLYSWSEYKLLKQKLGNRMVVLAIVAPREMRYDRLAHRPVRPLTRVEAESRDIAEIEQLEKGGPIAIADYTLLNQTTPEELLESLKTLVERLPKNYVKIL